jgi:23S rRNA (adenine2503-C2)-methyltransferase
VDPDPASALAPLAGLSFEELQALLAARGVPAPHAKRLVRACLRGGASDFADVPGLGAANVARLRGVLTPRATRVTRRLESPDGTVKLLLEGASGDAFEAVLMPLSKRVSGCVSSQVGCAAACRFCASGLEGLRRSLFAHEIVEQALALSEEARARGTRLSNLVFMGMGEPLHAYDAVVSAVRRLTDPRLLGFGCGHVTISTVGVVPGILALAKEGLGVHLAVSIHAADDALRRSLLPVGGRYTVAETLDAAQRFLETTGRFVTLEMTLLDGVNDGVEHAAALADAVDGRRFHVNVIPVNPVPGTPYRTPPPSRIDAYVAALKARGVVVHVRARRGNEVAAACGQLRRLERSPAAVVGPSPAGD